MKTLPINVLIIAPALNEAAVLPAFVGGFLALCGSAPPDLSLRLLIVDDGSTDATLDVLRQAAAANPHSVSYLSLAGNAGHQAALVAGMVHAGTWPDVLVTMDADLEHPFSVVPQLVEAWRRTGAVVVHALRRPTRSLGWAKRWPSTAFYRVTAGLTGLQLAPGQADFRLWDASAVRQVTSYLPHIGSLRVFAAWLPGRKEAVEFDQHVQADRRSRFTFRKNLELATISIIRFSHFPLRAITALGGLGLAFSLVYGVFIAVQTVRGNTIPGWSSTVLTVMTMGCLQLLSIGILASYLRRLVFARDLPPYIVRESRLAEPEGATSPR